MDIDPKSVAVLDQVFEASVTELSDDPGGRPHG